MTISRRRARGHVFLFAAILVAVAVPTAPHADKTVYTYVDEEGTLHVIDDPGLAPPDVALTPRILKPGKKSPYGPERPKNWLDRFLAMFGDDEPERERAAGDTGAQRTPGRATAGGPGGAALDGGGSGGSGRPGTGQEQAPASAEGSVGAAEGETAAGGASTAGAPGANGPGAAGPQGGAAGEIGAPAAGGGPGAAGGAGTSGGSGSGMEDLLKRLGGSSSPIAKPLFVVLALFLSGLIFAVLFLILLFFLTLVIWKGASAAKLWKRWAWRGGAVATIALVAALSLPPTIKAFFQLYGGMTAIAASREAPAADTPAANADGAWWRKHTPGR